MAILEKGYTFVNGEQLSSTKLNNLVDAAQFRTGAGEAVDGTTLLVDASGHLKLGTAQTGNIADSSITTSKIADSTTASDGITAAKIAQGAVTTVKISDANVTTAKIANANITAAKLSGAQSGNAPIFGIRAWAAFDGTATSPISPNASGNVASITRVSTGVYDVVFTTEMQDVNYAVVACSGPKLQTNGQAYGFFSISNVATTGFRMSMLAVSTNPSYATFTVIR